MDSQLASKLITPPNREAMTLEDLRDWPRERATYGPAVMRSDYKAAVDYEMMDHCERRTVNGCWNTFRAELLRMASENAELLEHQATLRFLYESAASEGDAARAELAALKQRIKDAPKVTPRAKLGDVAYIPVSYDLNGKRVALVVVNNPDTTA